MSKSLGNIYTIDELIKRGYDPLDYRFFCLSAHYRNKLNFTFEGMDGAHSGLKNLRTAANAHRGATGNLSAEERDELMNAFEDAINDDLNIPKALGVVWNAARRSEKSDDVYRLLLKFDEILGIDIGKEPEKKEPEEFVPDAEIQALIDARAAAKKEKNWAEADLIRDTLAAKGIKLIDTPTGVKAIKE